MITPKIQFPPKFQPAEGDMVVSNEAVLAHITPEEVWPYLVNISDWERFTKDVMDAQFLDPNVEDPHLYPKVEFEYRTAGMSLVARTLECIKPKDDRPGRISWEGTIKEDGHDEFNFVQAWLVSMAPDHSTHIITEVVGRGKQATPALAAKLHIINAEWLEGLSLYVGKHLTQTNHPRNPSTGPDVK